MAGNVGGVAVVGAGVAAAEAVESSCVEGWSGPVALSGWTVAGKTEKGCCCQTPCCGSHERVVESCGGWCGARVTGAGCCTAGCEMAGGAMVGCCMTGGVMAEGCMAGCCMAGCCTVGGGNAAGGEEEVVATVIGSGPARL